MRISTPMSPDRRQLRRMLLSCGTFLALGQAAPIWAQSTSIADAGGSAPASEQITGLQDIIVSARRVEERLQQVPLSVTALSTNALADAQINQLNDIKAQVSNLITVKTGTPGASLLTLRGQLSGQLPNPTIDNRVGTYLDGVYIARTQGGSFSLADIARLEVLKGPQGTLYGRNVTGGAINFVTVNPTGEFGGIVEAGFGNLGRQRYRVSIDLPAAGGLALHLGYLHDQLNGDQRNRAAGRRYGPFVNAAAGYNIQPRAAAKRLNGSNNDSFFAALRYDGVDGLTIDYKFDYSDAVQVANSGQAIGYGGSFVGCAGASLALGIAPNCPAPAGVDPGAGLVLPSPITSAAANDVVVNFRKQKALAFDQTAPVRTINQGHSLTINYEAADNITFKSITGYRRLSTNTALDTDGGDYFIINDVYNGLLTALAPLGAQGQPLPAGGVTPYMTSSTVQRQRQHQFSEELQAIATLGRFDLLGGLYHFQERGKILGFFQPNFNPIFSLFGSGIAPLSTTSANQVPNGAFANGDIETTRARSQAVFGRVTWHATDRIDVLLGARYTRDRKHNTIDPVLQAAIGDLDGNPANGVQLSPLDARVNFNRFTYEGVITYKVTPDVNIFARYTTAYLSGGLFKNQRFLPETAKDVEVGIKSEFFDKRLRVNVVGFAQTSKNLQLNGIVGAAGSIVIQNIGQLKTRGFEAEIAAVPLDGLTLGANLGYTHQRYSDGRRNLSPPWTLQLSLNYEAPKFANGSYLQVLLDGNYASRFYVGGAYATTDPRSGFDGTPLPPQVYAGYASQNAYLVALDRAMSSGGYWLTNARLSLVDIPFAGVKGRLSAFGRNLFNVRKVIYATNYGANVLANFEQDRTYGVDLRIAF